MSRISVEQIDSLWEDNTYGTFQGVPQEPDYRGLDRDIERAALAAQEVPSTGVALATPLSDELERNRIAMQQERTPAYGDALALCRRLERLAASPAPATPVATPSGWRVQRNTDGSIGLFAPTPRANESRRTSECFRPGVGSDANEIVFKFLSDILDTSLPAQEDGTFAEDVYDQLCVLLAPHATDTPGGLPGSVVGAFTVLLERHAVAASAQEDRREPATEAEIMGIAFDQRFLDGQKYLIAIARGIERFHGITATAKGQKP